MDQIQMDRHLGHKPSPVGIDPHEESSCSHRILISTESIENTYQNILQLYLVSYAIKCGPLIFPSLF